jgi:hypothetical protein
VDGVWDLERVRYVTENYERLQGLRLVPFGVSMLLVPVLYFLPPLGPPWEGAVTLALTLLGIGALLLSLVIRNWYEDRFGIVQRAPLGGRRSVTLAVAAAAYVASFVVVGQLVTHAPVNLPLLLFGVVITAVSWPKRRFVAHHLVMGVLMVALSLLPLAGVLETTATGGPYNLPVLVGSLGLFCTVTGVLDHRLLVSIMKRLPEEDGRAV